MPLNTTTRIDGVIVVYLSGAVLFGEESASLRILGKDLLNRSRQIVLDRNYPNSAFLQVIHSAGVRRFGEARPLTKYGGTK